MSLTSNVPALTITSTGVDAPTTNDVLNGVLDDFNQSFGGNLNITNVASPQYYLASALTYYIQNVNSALSSLCNQIDPRYAEGRMQDAIGELYFMKRKSATPTVVTCELIGQPYMSLPAGVIASDGTYNYVSTGAVTFSSGGTASVQFECSTLGNITCSANTLNQIVQAYPGWDAVNNSTGGVNGTDVESTYDFEYRRQQSVASNASSTISAIRGSVFSISDVIDCYAYANNTGSAVTVGSTSYSIAAHSIYVAAVGGTDSNVATAIFNKSPSGISTVGNTTVTVYDTDAPSTPSPSYSIKFNRPTSKPIYFAVRIGNYPGVPSNIVDLVRNAIIATFNGSDGTQRERIAQDIYASRYYSGIVAISPSVKLISVLMGTTSGDVTFSELSVGIDEYPTITAANISVTLV